MQELVILHMGASSFKEAIKMDVEVYHNLKNVLNNEEITDLAHPRIKDYVESEMSHMIEAAAACEPYSAAKRP